MREKTKIMAKINKHILIAATVGSAFAAAIVPSNAQTAVQPIIPAVQANSAVEKEILRLENERIQALVKRDFAALERLVAADCVHIESSGKMTDTAEFLASYKIDDSVFETFVIDESRVRVNGGTAVVTGSYHNRIRSGDQLQPIKYARFTRVWIERNGEWKMWSHQATAIPDAKQ